MAAEKNLARFLSVNFMRLAREVLVAFPRSGFDLDRTIIRLRHSIWGDDLTIEEKRDALFGGRGWDDLPMAVLAARYLQFPADRLPATRDSLDRLCRWLMSRDRNAALIDTFVRGWAGRDTPLDALTEFVDQLWRTREHDAPFFTAVIRGQHAIALEMIAERRLSSELSDDLAICILSRMALIWAAFDCQATAARARRSMTRPFGWLIIGAATRIRASTLVSVFRPIGGALRKFVTTYRTSEAAIGPNKPRSRLSAAADIRVTATDAANHIAAADGDYALDPILKEIAVRSGRSSDPFLEQVGKDQTDKDFGARQLSEFWYAGLLPLQIVGLVAMRLAQIEQQLELLLHDAVAHARETESAPKAVVPRFHDLPLLAGWKSRCRAIADALRGAVLLDPDYHSRRQPLALAGGTTQMTEGAANDDYFIDAVETFLAEAGQCKALIGTGSSAEQCIAFDDLDVAVGKRLGSSLCFLGRLGSRIAE